MVDTHTHAWGTAGPEHPQTSGPILDLVDSFDVHAVCTTKRLFVDIDRNDMDEAVAVGHSICDWTDNWCTRRVTAEYGRLHGIMMLDPSADDAVERPDHCMETDGVLSFRLGAACPYDRMWETFDPGVMWLRESAEKTAFWEAAVDHDAVVQILCDHGQPDQALKLIKAYSELTYPFDHFAHAGPETPTDEGMFGRFTDLAEHDSAAVKVSEVVHMSDSAFPYADMHDHVRWLLDTLGRERIVWGSDYPNVSDVTSCAKACNWLKQVDSLSRADRSWLTERSFRRHIDLG